MSKIAIIGSGFSGLSAAAYLSAAGHEVHVFEKNSSAGGRARQLKTANGYLFDMGPSWYWMPEVFEQFFNEFGFSVSDFYSLKLLDPSFSIVYGQDNNLEIPENFEKLCQLFESIEVGSAEKLKNFMQDAQSKYDIGMKNLTAMPGISILEFAKPEMIKNVFRLQLFSSFSRHIRKYFKHPKLIALMEFPILFLGAMPQDMPALYSLMNYAGLRLGTWYPLGGFGSIIESMVKLASRYHTQFHFNQEVEQIMVKSDKALGLQINGRKLLFDAILASADYHHVEQNLLPLTYRNYSANYWDKKIFAPSCLIYFIGLNKKLGFINHHTLFFDEALSQHSVEIYKSPQWPSKPLFYVCCPSRSDDGLAPEGHENLFLLMPLAVGLEDTEFLREKYFNQMILRLQSHVREEIKSFIDYKQSYCIRDFTQDYHAYKGNAYGLANTLMQTAHLKPKIRNGKIKNLFYSGQLTVPGPGVPPAIISGKLAANELLHYLKKPNNEIAF